MSLKRLGLFSKMWKDFKKSILISKIEDKYIGSDDFGNKYFEREEDVVNNLKRRRRVEPLDQDPTKVPQIPVEWITWLQSRRVDPPTPEEIEQNHIELMKTLARSAKLQEKDGQSQQQATQQKMLVGTFPVRPDYEYEPGSKSDS